MKKIIGTLIFSVFAVLSTQAFSAQFTYQITESHILYNTGVSNTNFLAGSFNVTTYESSIVFDNIDVSLGFNFDLIPFETVAVNNYGFNNTFDGTTFSSSMWADPLFDPLDSFRMFHHTGHLSGNILFIEGSNGDDITHFSIMAEISSVPLPPSAVLFFSALIPGVFLGKIDGVSRWRRNLFLRIT